MSIASGFNFSAETWYRIHFWLALAWMGPGTLMAFWIVFGIPDNKWASFAILMVSNYANFVSHWSAWQAVRAEKGTQRNDSAPTP